MIEDFIIILRYFVISVVFVGILQVETRGKSLEGHLTEWFYSSTVPQHIRTAAKGGALILENSAHTTKRFFKDTFSGTTPTSADRASR